MRVFLQDLPTAARKSAAAATKSVIFFLQISWYKLLFFHFAINDDVDLIEFLFLQLRRKKTYRW